MRTTFLMTSLLMLSMVAHAASLMTHGGFEELGKNRLPQGWAAFKAGKGIEVFQDEEQAYSGKASLGVRINNYESLTVIEQERDSFYPVESGKEYKVTFRYRLMELDQGYIHPFLIGLNENGNNIPFMFFRSPAMQRVDKNMKDAVNIFDNPSNTWKEIYIKFRTPGNVKMVKVHIEAEGKCRFNVDDFRIEEVRNEPNGIVWEADFQNLGREDVRKTKRMRVSQGVSMGEMGESQGLRLTFPKADRSSFSVSTDELLPLFSYEGRVSVAGNTCSGKCSARLLFYNSSRKVLQDIKADLPAGKSIVAIPFRVPEECDDVEVRLESDKGEGTLEIEAMTIAKKSTFDEKKGIYESDWQSCLIWDTYPNGQLCEGKTRYFRRGFELGSPVREARIRLFGQNKVYLSVNGKEFGEATLFQPQTFDIARALKPGKNVIAIKGVNTSGGSKLAFDMFCEETSGKMMLISSDAKTKVAEAEMKGWQNAEFDDSAWRAASVIIDSPSFFRNGKNYIGPRNLFNVKKLSLEKNFYSDCPWTVTLVGGYLRRHDFRAFDPKDFIGRFEFRKGEQLYVCSLTGDALKSTDDSLVLKTVTRYLPAGEYDVTLILDEFLFKWNGNTVGILDLGKIKCQGFSKASKRPVARIVTNNGKNTISVDGKPICPVNYLVFHPDFTDIKRLNDHNIKIHQMSVDSYGPATLNGDRVVKPDGTFDFSKTDKILYDAMQLVKDDENSYFIINLGVNVPVGWGEDLQDHVVTTSAGNKLYITNGRYCMAYKDKSTLKRTPFGRFAPSSASPVYAEWAVNYTRKIIEHLEQSPFSQRIIGYGLTGAFDGQWLNWELEGAFMFKGGMGDYSPVMLKAFRNHLRKKYDDDSALQQAWNNPNVTLDTAEIPNYEQRTKFFVDRAVADYNECYYQSSFKVFKSVCDTVKEVCHKRALVWAYKPESAQITYAFGTQKTTTHLGPEVYGLESLDIYSNPIDYYTRTLGIPTYDAPTAASLKIRGKLSRPELDLRTYLTGDMRMFLTPHTLRGTEEYFKKNAFALYMNGSTNHYYEFYPGWFTNAAINKTMGKLAEIDFDAIQKGFRWKPEICMLFSARSNLYLGNFDGKFARWTFFKYLAEQRRFSSTVMGRIGAGGYDGYYLEDVLLDQFPAEQYKVYVIVEAYHIPVAVREAIERKLKKNNNVIVWMWGAGFLDEKCSVSENSVKLNTGFTVKPVSNPKMRRQIKIAGTSHPFTAGMAGKVIGRRTSENCHEEIPAFCVHDSESTTLGTFPDGSPALAVKQESQSTSVYCAIHSIPPEILRNILKSRGVHIYADTNYDYVYTDGNYLGLHSGSGGHKTVKLPEKVRQVYDVFREKVIAENTDVIQFEIDNDEMAIFKLNR